jgi:ATP-dependent Clp protease ATP-binding subunit ClpB
MHERIIGQEEAISLVSSALRRARTEMREKNRPISSFLFLGPTGVGKTEVARALAAIYFNSENGMIRIDMSEYQNADALGKLIGSADLKSGGYLTEAVKKNPFSLILLDEIEKAAFDVLNIFLQVLEDGRLTDAQGKTIDFTNTIIIGTSNAGSVQIQEDLLKGKNIQDIKEDLINTRLHECFRPELLNRFDGVVLFHPLNMEHMVAITKLFLGKLSRRLEDKGIKFKAEETAIKQLASLGYNPTMGARPLRRILQDRVEDDLAKLLLAEKLNRRDELILGENLVLTVNKATPI